MKWYSYGVCDVWREFARVEKVWVRRQRKLVKQKYWETDGLMVDPPRAATVIDSDMNRSDVYSNHNHRTVSEISSISVENRKIF